MVLPISATKHGDLSAYSLHTTECDDIYITIIDNDSKSDAGTHAFSTDDMPPNSQLSGAS